MKRKISFILALTMLITIVPLTSFAEENYDKGLKEAIVKSKELFNIGSEYDKFTHNVTTRDGSTVFHLNWSDSKNKLGNVDVSIATDGTVVSYGKWKPIYDRQGPKLPKISKEEGLKIAKDFITKVSPKFANKIKHIDISELLNINSDGYNYYFVRTENNIPYYNNNIDIYVDKTTGEVKNYYANWDMNLEFSSKKDIISLEKAKKLYKEKIGINLIYKSTYMYTTPETFLAYGPLDINTGINAKDGEVIPLYNYYVPYEKTADMEAGDGALNELSPDEKKAVEEMSGLISKEEAEKIGREILEIDEEYKLNNINLYTSWRSDNDYNWEMSFMKKNDSKIYYSNISINAKTKKLVSFHKSYPFNENAKVKYNEDESLEIAQKFIKKLNPDNYKEIELKINPVRVNPPEEQRRYYFDFIRKIDNSYVQGEGITIYIDGVNGEVVEYRVNWSNQDFPSKDNVISIDKAYDILFNDIGIELKYMTNDRYDIDVEDKKEATLVYGLKNEKPANIDANTGTILNNNGNPYKTLTITNYKDIENSYAKDKINILTQYGIALPGENFNPNENINQKDFLYLLAKANSPYFEIDSSKDALYTHMINLGIIKENEKAPEKIVTKEEGIKYIIRAMNYAKIADLNDIYKDLFKDTKDIDPKLKGYVSIAHGLGIVQGDNDKLYPKVELKREDGASMIYNYLFNVN